jgi:hypothetical protein
MQVRIEQGIKIPLVLLVVGMLASSIGPSGAEAAPCTVQIKTEPKGASIYVNNRLQGLTPHKLKLPDQSAQYKLRLKLRGYEEYKTTISCAAPPSDAIALVNLPRFDVRIVFPSDLKYEGCGARVAMDWRSGRFSLARMELFPGDEKSYSGYRGEYMTITHSGYFFCPTHTKPYCLGKNSETEVIFDRDKSYEVKFKGQGDDCRTELMER